MKKRRVSIFVLLLLVCILSAQAVQAAVQRVANRKPDLFFQGTTAIYSALCRGDKATDKVEATLSLYQGNTYIDSWSESGIRKITLYGECKVTPGKT